MSTILKSLREDLVCEWLMNGNLNDTSGNGYTSTIAGPILTTDELNRKDRAYAFSGIPQYLAFNKLQVAGPMTIAFNIKNTTSITAVIFDTGGFTSSTEGMVIYQVSGILSFYVSDGSSIFGPVVLSGNIADGKWHTVVFTWTGISGTNGIKCYVDNVLTMGTSNKTWSGNSTWQYRFGPTQGGNTAINGSMSKIRIWDRILTAEEAKQLTIKGIGTPI